MTVDLSGTPLDPDYWADLVPAYHGITVCCRTPFEPGTPDLVDTHYGVMHRTCWETQK